MRKEIKFNNVFYQCININHLKGSTLKENSNDMVNKKRNNGLFKNGHKSTVKPKLTEKQVIEIRKLFKSHTLKEISNIYNVGISTISAIKTGQNWRWLK